MFFSKTFKTVKNQCKFLTSRTDRAVLAVWKFQQLKPQYVTFDGGFSCSMGKKKILYMVVSALKSCFDKAEKIVNFIFFHRTRCFQNASLCTALPNHKCIIKMRHLSRPIQNRKWWFRKPCITEIIAGTRPRVLTTWCQF